MVTLLFAVALSAQLRDGDLIFHQSRSAQSRAIQLATKSPYSHMGVLFRRGGRWTVYEAVGPVKFTPLDQWIARGDGGHFVVKRARTPVSAARLLAAGAKYRGKPYDFFFEWSDARVYCSELAWKMYRDAAGIEIGRLQRLRDFDLTAPAVRAKLAERYGRNVPLDEPVISPAAMFASDELVEVVRR
jgi:hypothetical protein